MPNHSFAPTPSSRPRLNRAEETPCRVRLPRLGAGNVKLRDLLLARCVADGQSLSDLEKAAYGYDRSMRSYSWFESIVMLLSTLLITSVVFLVTTGATYLLGWDGSSLPHTITLIGLGSISTTMVCVCLFLVCLEVNEARLRNERRHKQRLTTCDTLPPPLWRLFLPFTYLAVAVIPAFIAFRLRGVFGSLPLPEHPAFASAAGQTEFAIALSLAMGLMVLILMWVASPISDMLYSRFRPEYALARKLSSVRIMMSDWSTQEDGHYQQKHVVRRLTIAADILDDYCWHKYRYLRLEAPKKVQNATQVMRDFGRLWDNVDKRADLTAEIERAIIIAARAKLDELFVSVRPLRTRSSGPPASRPDPRQRTSRRLRKIASFARVSLLLAVLAAVLPKSTPPNWLFDLTHWLPKLLLGFGK